MKGIVVAILVAALVIGGSILYAPHRSDVRAECMGLKQRYDQVGQAIATSAAVPEALNRLFEQGNAIEARARDLGCGWAVGA